MSVLKIANAKSIRFNSLLNTFFYVWIGEFFLMIVISFII